VVSKRVAARDKGGKLGERESRERENKVQSKMQQQTAQSVIRLCNNYVCDACAMAKAEAGRPGLKESEIRTRIGLWVRTRTSVLVTPKRQAGRQAG
jgi:hypothetical protein